MNTLENETVLDFTMGSGTTGVACKNTNRNFIGIELDENYYNIATKRIEAML
jgi:site-specific DNA-methyltransferase (adenine-specific)